MSGGIYEIGRTLTADEILTLATEPVELVAEREHVAVPIAVTARVRVTTPLVGAGNLAIGYPDPPGVGNIVLLPAAVLAVTTDSVAWAALGAAANWGPDSQLAGPLSVWLEGGVDPTEGEITVDLIVEYLGVPRLG
jgi:hypothetical protein